MSWLVVLIALTYCFTVAFTAKYKDESIGYREKMLDDKKEFETEIVMLLEEIERLKNKLNRRA